VLITHGRAGGAKRVLRLAALEDYERCTQTLERLWHQWRGQTDEVKTVLVYVPRLLILNGCSFVKAVSASKSVDLTRGFFSYDAAASLAVEVVRELLEYLWRPPSAQFLRLRVCV
jgi:hypothetical protein